MRLFLFVAFFLSLTTLYSQCPSFEKVTKEVIDTTWMKGFGILFTKDLNDGLKVFQYYNPEFDKESFWYFTFYPNGYLSHFDIQNPRKEYFQWIKQFNKDKNYVSVGIDEWECATARVRIINDGTTNFIIVRFTQK